jgi:tetratricopeptide (TPR) repeat protein
MPAMNSIAAELDRQLARLEPYWARLDGFWLELQARYPMLQGLGSHWLVIGGVALALLVIWLLIRSRGGGRRTSARALRATYRKATRKGVKEWERPYALFRAARNWDALPDHFLWELTARLMDKDSVIDFIIFVERHGLEQSHFPELARNDVAAAMRGVSGVLANLATTLKGRAAETALSLASLIDPRNPQAVFILAAQRYAAERFEDAIPLLEQAIPLCEESMVEPARPDVRALQRGAESSGNSLKDLQHMLHQAQEMYEDCLHRANPEPA